MQAQVLKPTTFLVGGWVDVCVSVCVSVCVCEGYGFKTSSSILLRNFFRLQIEPKTKGGHSKAPNLDPRL